MKPEDAEKLMELAKKSGGFSPANLQETRALTEACQTKFTKGPVEPIRFNSRSFTIALGEYHPEMRQYK